MASKNIVADLNKGEKLNGDNFDIWHRKIQYVLNEQEVEDLLTYSMTEPEKGDTVQHTLDLAAYDKWRKRDRCARSIMLSSMSNDLLDEFDEYPTAEAMWKALKAKYGGTSATRLRGLTIRFDSYKMRPEHTMRQHLRTMSSMIRELKAAGNNLTDEQQIQALIRSLPETWDDMSLNLTHNENLKTFDDVGRHLELEAERREAAKPKSSAHMVESSSRKASRPKRKFSEISNKQGLAVGPAPKKAKVVWRKRGKRGGKKGKAKLVCFNCNKEGHFARDCTEPRKIQQQPSI